MTEQHGGRGHLRIGPHGTQWIDETGAVEAANARDRLYFAAHPDAQWYLRDRAPGEFPDAPVPLADCPVVLVQVVGPTIRVRIPISEDEAHALATGADVRFTVPFSL